MKKILYVTDAPKLAPATLDFACYLCNLSHSRLVGVFLENLDHEVRTTRMLKEVAMASGVDIRSDSPQEIKDQCTADNIQVFKKGCEQREVIGIVHRDG